MGVRRALGRLAEGDPAPVFVLAGAGGREAAEDLRLEERLRVVTTPRAATVLLVVGRLTERLLPAAMLLHDQVPAPRSALQWLPGGGDDPLASRIPGLARAADPATAAARAHRSLLRGGRGSPDAFPDLPAAPWHGVGPYGQGGKGMTGGVPYGRPLPGRADDRDGLKLDAITLRVGPAHPALPSGLELEVRLQGDVVQEARVAANAMEAAPPTIFTRALREPVSLADLEVARARSHLRWLAGALRLGGLEALGMRVHRLAVAAGPADAEGVASLARRLDRGHGLRWALGGVGVIDDRRAAALPAGPVARASGRAGDARTGLDAYRSLGFEPHVEDRGDARARWRQRLVEAAQALTLAGRAGDAEVGPAEAIEGPRGTLGAAVPSAALLDLLPDLLPGMEWGDATTTIASLDLDLEEAAARAEAPA